MSTEEALGCVYWNVSRGEEYQEEVAERHCDESEKKLMYHDRQSDEYSPIRFPLENTEIDVFGRVEDYKKRNEVEDDPLFD